MYVICSDSLKYVIKGLQGRRQLESSGPMSMEVTSDPGVRGRRPSPNVMLTGDHYQALNTGTG